MAERGAVARPTPALAVLAAGLLLVVACLLLDLLPQLALGLNALWPAMTARAAGGAPVPCETCRGR